MNDQEALRQAKSREFGEATQQAFEPAQGTFLGNAAQTARGGAIAGAWRPKLFEVLKDARGVTPEVEKCVADVMTYQPWDERQKLAGAMVVAALSSAIRTIIEHVPPQPHRSEAIQRVIEARLLANSAITHRGNL